ncbi:MAG: ATP-binding cassette domain-containing protein, partial [bacterium]|nr:ATP-binding cassette domain-containing protein [bacterium]
MKLKLDNIIKTYWSGETVTALKGISLKFRGNEFVSILGPSGCGKTTMLNIIGGLDRYDSGDLIINGMSTKEYKDSDWDAYRNRSIGFVFQSYNLIGHQSVLQNVEIALTLSGVSVSERRIRATQALCDVGLSDQVNKKPNQLSGGQMQRVAIARALVNNPDIILLDEPTGALDIQTSFQFLDILKEISKTRLVIMVTHNRELAEKYSDRIIRLVDGEIQSDSNPVSETDTDVAVEKVVQKEKLKMTSMSLATATSLSFKNLLTKRGRTIITAFAGSIGIIGVALVLALSSGLSAYMGVMQTETLSGFPVTISTIEQSFNMEEMRARGPLGDQNNEQGYTKLPSGDIIYRYDSEENQTRHTNVLSEDYLNYIDNIKLALPNTVNTISYQRGITMNLLAKGEDSVVKFETSALGGRGPIESMGGGSYWQEMPDNTDFILSLYDLIGEGSRLPATKNEIVIIVDKYNRLDNSFFERLGMPSKEGNYSLKDFIGKTMLKVVYNDDFYKQNGEIFNAASVADYNTLYNDGAGIPLTIVGILRTKEDVTTTHFSEGFAYTTALTDAVVDNAKISQVAMAQIASEKNVLTGAPFANDVIKTMRLRSVGADTAPTGINIYPVDFTAKESIKEYLDKYNDGKADAEQVIYSDLAKAISDMTGTLLNTVSYVLIGFAAISLLVSTIMIGIITYVSVIERTKEIGILRSVGARKKDISRVFNAETLIIGFIAGTFGVTLSYLLSVPINAIIFKLAG